MLLSLEMRLPWLQDYVMAAEQDANEANIETAKCAKEAAVAKEEAPVDISLWVKFPASLVFQ